jgi:hypothetical protein
MVYTFSEFPRTEDQVKDMDLSFIKDSWNADMLRDAIRAVVRVERSPDMQAKEFDVWMFMSTYDPPEGRGFMFSDHPITTRVMQSMEVGHSGTSYGFTMRHLQYFARNGGVEGYKREYIKNTA